MGKVTMDDNEKEKKIMWRLKGYEAKEKRNMMARGHRWIATRTAEGMKTAYERTKKQYGQDIVEAELT